MFDLLSAHLNALLRPSRRSLPRRRIRLELERLEDRLNMSTAFLTTNLVSDLPGVAFITDPTLQNAFGISLSPTSGAFWISSNEVGLSELYAGDVNGSPITQPFKVNIPGGAPTGQLFNGTGSPTDFSVTDGTNTKPAVFIFASESGAITGWNPGVGAVPGVSGPSTVAEVGFQATDGAIYKGIATAQVGGKNYLFATDFHNGKIDVFDSQFHKVDLGQNGFGTFTDPNLPAGYAPFGIAAINGKLYVSYAQQDADAEDDVAGKGHGFIDVFDTSGHFQQRLVSKGDLNSPWGMVLAPAGFGDFGNALLVGNFGDGHIHAFDPNTGKELGTLSASKGHPVQIDGLWGLAFGNGNTAGDANTLYFAAGPDHETHGLFGKITANPAGTNPVQAVLNGSDLLVTGSPDNDHITVSSDRNNAHLIVRSDGQTIGTFDTAAISTIRVSGLAGDDSIVVDPRVTITTILDGGAGNNTLIGGGGSNILLGGSGNDTLVGGRGRDILIGGAGSDHLIGNSGDDILVGGSTNYDMESSALLQILNEWNSTSSFNDRVTALRSGNGVPQLDSTTVVDDGARDTLFGGPGLDWFFSTMPDRIRDQTPGEPVN